MFRSKGKLCKTWIFILIGMLLITAGTCIWYVNDYYPSEITIQDYTQKNSAVQLTKIENGLFLDGEGVDCFLLKMPGT